MEWKICILVCLQCVLCVKCVMYDWGRVTSGEYCDHETFEASCNADEIIVIGSAEYGHMALGKCIQLDLGVFGCMADVTELLNDKCSGKKSCSLNVDDESLRKTKPCTTGITVYLKATYMCVKAVPDATLCQSLSAQSQTQYISSSQAMSKRCTSSTGLFDQEFGVIAKAGQQLSFTLIDLAAVVDTSSLYQDKLGYIIDTGSEKVYPILQNGRSESQTAVTDTHSATVVISSSPSSNFLVAFKAIGCADLSLPTDVRVSREENKATVGCINSRQTWQLTCINSHWTGVIGNCTTPVVPQPVKQEIADYKLPLPRDIIFVIIGCATFFVAVVVVTAGYVCLKWPKKQKRQQADVATLRFGNVKHKRVPSTAGSEIVYLTPRYPPEGETSATGDGDYQPIWEKPLPRPPNNAELQGTSGRGKRNNDEVYNLSLSSNSTDYERKKYFVLDKDYINANGTLA